MFQSTELNSTVSGSKLWDLESAPRPAADVPTLTQRLAFEFVLIIFKLIFVPRCVKCLPSVILLLQYPAAKHIMNLLQWVLNSILSPFLEVERQS